MNEQLDKVKAQLQEELKNVSSLQAKVSELEVCVFQASNNQRLHCEQIRRGGRVYSEVSGKHTSSQRNSHYKNTLLCAMYSLFQVEGNPLIKGRHRYQCKILFIA